MPFARNLRIVHEQRALRVTADFAAVERIARVKSPRVCGIYGEDVREELAAFSQAMRAIRAPFSTENNLCVAQRPSFRGRASIYNRFEHFLSHRGLHAHSEDQSRRFHLSGSNIETCAEIDPERLLDAVAGEFLSSRKGGEKFVDELVLFARRALSAQAIGPVVLSGTNFDVVPFLQAFRIRQWHLAGRVESLIVLYDAAEPPEVGIPLIERDYISEGDLIQYVSKEMGIADASIKRSLPGWRASLYGDGLIIARSAKYSGYLADRFIRAAQNIENISELSDLEDIPDQNIAPIKFDVTDSAIGLLESRVPDVSVAQVVGAARALRALAIDLLQADGLDNALPNWRGKVGRIASIAERISRATVILETDIVEFGVEISAFESRIHDGRSRIGELSLGEALSFLIEARVFLSRFDFWLTYQITARDRVANATVGAEAALDLLRSFAAAQGVLSDAAKNRVDEFADVEIVDTDDSVKAEGYSSVAKNLAAAAAKTIINEVKATGGQAKSEIKTALAKRIAEAIKQNSGAFVKFAAVHGERWLDLLVQYVREHGP